MTATTAPAQGALWGARAADWARFAAPISSPAWIAIADALALGEGITVLDVGCGSGEFCRLAAGRRATVSGIDASEALIAIARRTVPASDLRVGAMESLPWPDGNFDAVTAFNALQFIASVDAALAEAARVTRRGGRVAICNWGHPDDSELFAVVRPLRELQAPRPPSPPPPALGEPGTLERLLRRADLEPETSGDVDVPFECADEATFIRALEATAGAVDAIEHSGEQRVRAALTEAGTPFRRPDGSYRLENHFRYFVARR